MFLYSYPPASAQQVSRAAEVFEQTLELLFAEIHGTNSANMYNISTTEQQGESSTSVQPINATEQHGE